MKLPAGKVFLSLAFILLAALQLFAQTAGHNSSVKIEIKNSAYIVSGVVSSAAVKDEIVARIGKISKSEPDFSGLKVDSTAEPFAAGWQKDFDKALFKSSGWKSGVFIFTANPADAYPKMPDEILNAEIFLHDRAEPVKLSDYGDKTVVLFFLATWCSPCRAQAESLKMFYSRVSPGKVEIIAVDVDEDDGENFKEFARQLDINYKTGAAGESLYNSALKISKFPGIPQILLTRGGRLYGVFTGGSPKVQEKLEETILKVAEMR